ncbi:hypothetical protein I4F81_001010 [Pyropia yezoensis]|uniref:Uncharacterized protein n=1 Tax=Pyropia yezoensis TaxID=2788 RepID=A0ACC3BKE2_PYRYE|nr:hypothetical protein I4F81_001010 [Neopyropia yezoensis]
MGALIKFSAVAVVAAAAVSLAAATSKPIVIVHGTAPTAKPTAKPTPTPTPTPHPALVGVDPVCRVYTKKCCYEPYVCGVAHQTEELTVVVDCHKAVLVETSCALPALPHGMHEVVEEAVGGGEAAAADAAAAEGVDLDATERLNGHAVYTPPKVPTKCYEHKKVAHTCHKPVSVTKAYPKVCYKKKCVKTETPKDFKTPSKYVALEFGVEVPQAQHHW